MGYGFSVRPLNPTANNESSDASDLHVPGQSRESLYIQGSVSSTRFSSMKRLAKTSMPEMSGCKRVDEEADERILKNRQHFLLSPGFFSRR